MRRFCQSWPGFATPGHCRGPPPGCARGGPGCGSVPRESTEANSSTLPEPVPFVVLLYEGPMRPAQKSQTVHPKPPQLFPTNAFRRPSFCEGPIKHALCNRSASRVELCLSRPASLPQGSSAVLPRQGRPPGFASPLMSR